MRVFVIVSTTVVMLTATMLAMATFGSSTADESGHRLYPYRRVLAQLEEAKQLPPPAVVWLGDSTLVSNPTTGLVAYPQLVQQFDLAPSDRTSISVQGEAFDPYTFHSLIQPALALRPRVVVIIAHLRSFADGSRVLRTFDDLTAAVPAAHLATLLTLPYGFRGMTLSRLLITRLLRYDAVLQVFYWFEGLRDDVQHAQAWDLLGPESPAAASELSRVWLASSRAINENYDTPITPHGPLVRFLAATVQEVSAAGASPLVIVTPVPVAELARNGHYDAAVFAERIGVLREAVERAGGTLLDLHSGVDQSAFRDLGGHFNPDGMARMRSLVWPTLSKLLQDPAVAPTRT